MAGQKGRQLYYLAPSRVKKLCVQRKGSVDCQPIHLGTVEISPTYCNFEGEGWQAFRVGEKCDIVIDAEDSLFSAKATIVLVAKFEMLDEGYQYKTWFSYGAEFDAELDTELFQRIVGDPKRTAVQGLESFSLN